MVKLLKAQIIQKKKLIIGMKKANILIKKKPKTLIMNSFKKKPKTLRMNTFKKKNKF